MATKEKENNLLADIKRSKTLEEFKALSEEFLSMNLDYSYLVRYLLTERFNDYQDKDRVFNLMLDQRLFKINPRGNVFRIDALAKAAKASNIKLNLQIFADFYLKQGNISDIKYFYKYIDKSYYNSVKFETYLMFE